MNYNMNDGEGVTVKLAELLRHPEDLDKIPALKSEFTRKKGGIDGQLKLGLKEQLEVTQSGMGSITDGQRTVNLIKEEMMRIDKLCAEAQNMIRDFPNINLVSRTHRNFAQVETMRSNLESFNDRLSSVEQMLREDDDKIEEMPNFLPIHYELSQLRNNRDDAIDQIRKAADPSLQRTLEDYFHKLDDTINWFDEHVGVVCMNMINVVQSGNAGLVVRLAVIIEEEEKNDKKVKALQEAQRDYKELAARFKSITTGPKELRGYKEKFLESIKLHAQEQFDTTIEQFLEDPDKLEKGFRWFFNDLNTVKLGMTNLMPKKWRIFKTYTTIYHTLMHDNLIKLINDPDLPPTILLAIIHWTEKYYAKMAKLGHTDPSAPELQPHIIDDREADLVREWRMLIIKFLDEWMSRIFQSDKMAFTDRKPDALDRDENGYFRTANLVDTWRMLREQTMAAATAERTDVAEGVIDAMLRVLRSRQSGWQKMIDDESTRYSQPASSTFDPQDGYQSLQDWLAAVANDQIACIDDGNDEDESSSQLGYLTRFRRDLEPLVSPEYLARASQELDQLRDGYVDLGTHCVTTFAGLIFVVDFRPVMADFFTSRWYGEAGMKRLTSTFEDYLSDYAEVLHPSLLDILVEELADALLTRYLAAVRNKGAKLRRADPFEAKLRDDVITAFDFFERFPDFINIKQKWRVVDWFSRLLASEKAAVPEVYAAFKTEYWDLQISWVEAVLRARDDFERSMLNAVKSKAAVLNAVRGPETVMSKVK
ncbi:MAG: SNARE-binding exocyst subunit S6 [Sclerophora amabilis]|nr:MAG: SNARE-binding exocyst subunit S6 [Sclerophora amabilis]